MEWTENNTTQTETVDTAAAPGGNRVRVLAVDDNDDFRSMLVDLLKPLGYEVKTAANPIKALDVFRLEKTDFQLVILDYYMPQLDGGKTFEWLRKLNPDVKVIICSGADELRLRQIQTQYKIDGYLHKPFRVPEALAMIKRVMGERVPATA